ncbi:MAG: PorV/PorQ family protein [Flavobacteriaceae bacterium]|nr:PorV/PorQ family protein [Flavobacteriaceae bacterium]
MKKLYLSFFILLGVINAQSQVFRKFSNEFLNLGVGADAFAMGKAVVASTKGVNSGYWNPAGLVDIKETEASLMHAAYFQGIANYDFAAYAIPINRSSTLAFYALRFGVDDILNTTELIDNQGNIDFNRISLFSATDYAFNMAYAKKLNKKGLSIGFNAKVIRRIIGKFANAWGFGLDFGLQYRSEKYNFGLMLRDASSTFNAWTINQTEFDKISAAIPGQNQELPQTVELSVPKIQLGFARNFKINYDFSLLAEADINIRFKRTNDLISTALLSMGPSLGFELNFQDLAFLRAGVTNFQSHKNFDNSKTTIVEPNIGLGFIIKGIQIDYALSNIGGSGGTLFSNVFSVKIALSKYR